MTPRAVVDHLLASRARTPVCATATASAAANIALAKYWGKRDDALRLPLTDSLSVSLGHLGTTTTLTPRDGADEIYLNGALVPPTEGFARRLSAFLDLFRAPAAAGHGLRVDTTNRIPTAAGLASSASGFAALVLALDQLHGWDLPLAARSILARLGSGSACRSVAPGFLWWHAGTRADGMDSAAEPLADTWPALRLGVLVASAAPKAIGSGVAMDATRQTSPLYAGWPAIVARDLAELRAAITARDLPRLGAAAERNALAMHATMLGAATPTLYWLPETVAMLRTIWSLRAAGLPLYATLDAGPNVKLLFTADATAAVQAAFPAVQVVVPFPA